MKSFVVSAVLLLQTLLHCSALWPSYVQQAYSAPNITNPTPQSQGSFGMDFDVLLPIEVFAVGYFVLTAEEVPPTIYAAIFDRATEAVVNGTMVTSANASETTTTIGNYAFVSLEPAVSLGVGHYSIVASGYSHTYTIVNTLFDWREAGRSLPMHGADKTCPSEAISFVGSSRYDDEAPLEFPWMIGQSVAQFAAGSFLFATAGCAGPPPPSFAQQAYSSLPSSVGNSAPSCTTAGMDFDVLLSVQVFSIGVFNNNKPLMRAMRVALFDRMTQTVVSGTDATLTHNNTVVSGQFSMLGFDVPVTLAPGAYSVVAFGYGEGHLFVDDESNNQPTSGVDGKNCSTPSLAFVGVSRFSNATTFGYPRRLGSVAAQFCAGTFLFSTVACPAGPPPPATAHLAYSTQISTGNAFVAGSVGMDFDVNFPIRLYSIGYFDNNYSSIPHAMQVAVFNRDSRTAVSNTVVTFEVGMKHERTGFYSMRSYDSYVELGPGNYSIVVFGYSASFPFADGSHDERRTSQPVDGGMCGDRSIVSFVGCGRISNSSSSSIVELPDPQMNCGASPAPFAAGTFTFDVVRCPQRPPPYAQQAYNSNAPIGDIESPGSIGMDFAVAWPVELFSIGVYTGNRELPYPMQVAVFNFSTELPVPGTLVSHVTRDNSDRVGLYAMYTFPSPVMLPIGSYSIVAFGYDKMFQYVDSQFVGQPTNGVDPRCSSPCISFVGSSRWMLANSLVFPLSSNGRAAAEFAAGSFTFAGIGCVAAGTGDTLTQTELILVIASAFTALMLCIEVVRRWGPGLLPRLKKKNDETTPLVISSLNESDDHSKASSMSQRRDLDLSKTSFTRLKLIGRGANGSVYTCALPDGSVIAIKEVLLTPGISTRKLQQAQREIEIASTFNHPNIVRFFGSSVNEEEQKLTIFMELVSNGSLGSAVRGMKSPIPDDLAKCYAKQILSALVCIHEKGIVHRDLKCDNILLSQDGTCKLSDFGSARSLRVSDGSLSAHTIVGTPYFMAPEMLNGSGDGTSDDECGYGRSADIWSLGITVLEMMCCGMVPWPSLGSINATILHIASESSEPLIPDSLSSGAADFVRCCCKRNPLHRSTSKQLLSHRWIMEAASPHH